MLHNSEAVARRCSTELMFLKICKIHRKTPVPESPFNKVGGPKACNFFKETPAQVFSWEFRDIFNIFFTEHLWVIAYDNSLRNFDVKGNFQINANHCMPNRGHTV